VSDERGFTVFFFRLLIVLQVSLGSVVRGLGKVRGLRVSILNI
jgi:hypothetical protein